jgi:UDP-N-acetylmuramoylalanine--D-glutamate ligase
VTQAAQRELDLLARAGGNVVIWGFGKHGGGQAAARFCAARGARVTVLDLKPRDAFGAEASSAQAAEWDWAVGDGSHPLLRTADLIVASPAIPPRAWPAHHAVRTSPEGLFCAAHRGPRVAITGTKGKSTTAQLLATLLGWKVAGNSYEPLLDLLLRHGPEVPLVCELSSFQLWYLAATAPRFAGVIFTSLAVDHLDWHPDLAHYHASKLALLDWAPAVAVAEDVWAARTWPTELAARRVAPVTYREGVFISASGIVAQRADLPLLGEHNARNAALALALAAHLGVAATDLAPRLRTVQGLPHRLEVVPGADGRLYFNDSIATTPESAMAALAALPGPLAIILGGSDKGASFAALAQAVRQRGAVPILIGAIAERLAVTLRAAGVEPILAGTLPQAVAAARLATPPEGTVLLSPACASFDQFQGFEDRGRRFRALAAAL